MIHRLLADFPPHGVAVFTTGNVRNRLNAIEATAPDDSDTTLLIGRTWERIPEREHMIREIAELLAESALASWPRWYDDAIPLLPKELGSPELFMNGEAVVQRAHLQRHVLPEWLKRATRCCVAQRSPLLDRYPIELQLRQLALAMSWRRFVLVLAVDAKTLSPGEAKCFADVCAWTAQLAEIRIAVVLDEVLVACPGFDAICYGVQSLDPPYSRDQSRESDAPERPEPRPSSLTAMKEDSGATRTETASERRADRRSHDYFAWPVIGMPHPFSPGEQRLSRSLSAASDLRGLFQFNWPVTTSTGNRYVVDLFCESIRLIVEVDGYSTHASRASFQADRDRDFSLVVDGYTVVRLTPTEVASDIDGSLSKLRAILRSLHVRFRDIDP